MHQNLCHDLDYFIHFSHKLSIALSPALQLYSHSAGGLEPHPFQCTLHQPMADGEAVPPPLGQSVPGVLDAPAGESKLQPALCCQRNVENHICNVSGGSTLLPWTPSLNEVPAHPAQPRSALP